MFISANVHSQIRSIFAGARSTVFQSRWACVTARGTHVTAGGPASQPGDVGWAGCCTPCLDVRLRPAGMGAWSPPHPPCEVPTNGHSVCVRVPCRPRRCGGREDTAVAPRVLPVGREAGQEVALATVRGPGRRGAGRPGRGFTSGHTGDQARPWRLLQKTAGVTKSTRRGRAGATSSGNGPNVRAVTCAGASLTRRKAHRSPRGERAEGWPASLLLGAVWPGCGHGRSEDWREAGACAPDAAPAAGPSARQTTCAGWRPLTRPREARCTRTTRA